MLTEAENNILWNVKFIGNISSSDCGSDEQSEDESDTDSGALWHCDKLVTFV